MPRPCTACVHDQRAEIDAALVSGTSLRKIAERFGVSSTALHRHRDHVSAAVVAVAAERDRDQARTLLDRVEDLEVHARRILEAAEEAGNVHQQLGALRELRGIVELLGKATGELRDVAPLTVNLFTTSDWVDVRALVLEAVPVEARPVFADRLRRLEAGEPVGT